MPSSLRTILSMLAVGLALLMTGCASSGNSTSAYGGANVGAAVARQDKAVKNLKSAKSEFRAIERKIKTGSRALKRAERRLKRKRISSKRKRKLQATVTREEKAIKQNEKSLKIAERALKRAERRAKQTQQAAIRAQKREDARVRAQARREEVRKKRKLALAESKANGSSGSIFAFGADPALKFAKDYRARVDDGFKLPAIPIKKMDKKFLRQKVSYPTTYKPGTLVVDTSKRFVYLVQSNGTAMRYGIGVGRAGFAWEGTATMTWKKKWPTWTPPPEMIARQPKLAKFGGENGMKPGIDNPLGARALYIFQNGKDTLYRLHGSPEWASIGTAASSGCIRLINQDIIDLYSRVPNGAKIVVKQS